MAAARLAHAPRWRLAKRQGLVIAMPFSRQYVVDTLRRLGYTELADRAAQDLPDPVDGDQLEAWCTRHGISRDEMISQMGGSP
jgi:acyl-CoA synthetase (AMP-forming)/AMP-acid ligase II